MGKRRNPKDPPKDHQFKPGQSGNPGGVAAGKRISTWLVELGQMSKLPDPDTLPINGRIALARIQAAMTDRGERSTEIILDRTEGKLKPEEKPEEEKDNSITIVSYPAEPDMMEAWEKRQKEFEEQGGKGYPPGVKVTRSGPSPSVETT